MVKVIGLALLSIVVTLVAFTIFSLATVPGREATVCALRADIQAQVARTPDDKARLALVLPLSGTQGSPDAEAPVGPMQWLAVQPDFAVPLPQGTWRLARHGTDSVTLERESAEKDGKDDILIFGQVNEAGAEAEELYSKLGALAFGKPMVLGELMSRAYGLDLTVPCDPKREARALILDGLLLSIKSVAAPGRVVSGVRDQLPHATTIERLRPDGVRRSVEATFQAPGNERRWLHLTYLLSRAEDAADVMRALRLATRSQASHAGSELSVEGWPGALQEAGLATPKS